MRDIGVGLVVVGIDFGFGEVRLDVDEALFEGDDAAEKAVDGAVELGVGFEHGEAGVDGGFDGDEFGGEMGGFGLFEVDSFVPGGGFDVLGAGDFGAGDGDFAHDVGG